MEALQIAEQHKDIALIVICVIVLSLLIWANVWHRRLQKRLTPDELSAHKRERQHPDHWY